ncbi:MAG: InlB B-repeat-containing protein [Oscillospiraceae bacterium]|nr:InlB B-repeat-containing protein [Oscillospiraceae bacterium]
MDDNKNSGNTENGGNYYYKDGFKHYYDPNAYNDEEKRRKKRALLLIPLFVALASIAAFIIVGAASSSSPPAQKRQIPPRPAVTFGNTYAVTEEKTTVEVVEDDTTDTATDDETGTDVVADASRQPNETTDAPATTGIVAESRAAAVPRTLAPREYIIEYDANDGDVESLPKPNYETKLHGEAITLSDTIPEREGYTFVYWSEYKDGRDRNKNNRIIYYPEDEYLKDASTILYAIWKCDICECVCPCDCGCYCCTTPRYGKNVTVETAETITPVTATETTTDETTTDETTTDDETTETTDETTTTDDETTTTDETSSTPNETTTTAETTTTDAASETTTTPGTAMIIELDTTPGTTVTLNTLVYNINGGNPDSLPRPNLVSIPADGQTTLSNTVPTRDGYVFVGWTPTMPYNGSVLYRAGEQCSLKASATLYALWNVAPPPGTCTITYVANANDATNMPSPNRESFSHSAITTNGLPQSAHILSNAVPKKPNYEFMGWSTSPTGTVEYVEGSIFYCPAPNTSTVLYAVWVTEKYDISYNIPNCTNCGKALSTAANLTPNGYYYDVGAILPVLSPINGHSFEGWYPTQNLSGAPITEISRTESGDKQFWAKFTDDLDPTGTIFAGSKTFANFINTISFGLFYKNFVSITVRGADAGCGVKEIAYIVLEENDPQFPTQFPMSEDYINRLLNERSDVSVTPYPNTPGTADLRVVGNRVYPWKGVVFARITDANDNVSIIASNGLETCNGMTWVPESTVSVYKDYISVDALKPMEKSMKSWGYSTEYVTCFEYYDGTKHNNISFNVESILLELYPNFEEYVKTILFEPDIIDDDADKPLIVPGEEIYTFPIKAQLFAYMIANALQVGFRTETGDDSIEIIGTYIEETGEVRFSTLGGDKGFNAYTCTSYTGNIPLDTERFAHQFLHLSCNPDPNTRIESAESVAPIRPGYWVERCYHAHSN